MAADTTKLNIELVTLLRGLNQTLRGLDQIKRKLESVASVKVGSGSGAAQREQLATERLALAQQRLEAQKRRLATQTQELANRQERARQASDRLAQSSEKLKNALSKQGKVIGNIQKQLGSLSAAALRIGGGLRSLGLTASVTLTAPLVALATAATKNAVEFDSLRRGLEVMAGSSQEAAKQLERLKEIAKAPGIGFQEAIQGSIRLQAVGFSARDAEKALVQFANAVALTGGGREELERVTVQLGQLAAKGKVVAQDLKPILEAAPAVNQALLQAFGTVNAEDIQKLGLSSQEFFNKLTDALAKLPRAAAGAKNAFENFSDSLFRASLALGDAILPPLQKIAEFVESIITKLAEQFRQLPEGIQLAVIAFGALVAAAGPILFVLGGIASGLGAIGTALAVLIPILASIGLPAILAIIAGLAIVIGEITTVVVALGVVWKTNFLGIRELATDAAKAITRAFQQIRLVFAEAIQRILPTLESITTKVLGAITAAWEKYGKVVVETVGDAFRFVVDFTVKLVRIFANFVDLVLKLIDGDWKGAWAAFSRIVISALADLPPLLLRLQAIIAKAFIGLASLMQDLAIRFIVAAERLAVSFMLGLTTKLISESPKLTSALEDMFLNAALGFNATTIAAMIVARILDSMRRAASDGFKLPVPGEVGGDVSIGEGIFRGKGRSAPRPVDKEATKQQRADEREARRLRDAQDKLAEQQIENRITNTRAGIDQQFELTRDGLEREGRLLDNAFEDRLKSVRAFFAERKRIQEAEIDNELKKEKDLNSALADEFKLRRQQIQAEFKSSLTDINEDSRLRGKAKQLAIQTAETKKQTDEAKALSDFETASAEISTRILTLQKARTDAALENTRAEELLTRELTKQRDELRFSLLEEQGRTSDAELGRLKQRFTDTIRELRIDVTGLPEDLQKAIDSVDLSTLQQQLDRLPEPVQSMVELLDIGIKRAQIAESQRLVEDLSSGLRIDEQAVQNRVLDGLISQREAQAQIVAIQQKYRAVLLDILKGELAKAEAIKDQGVIVAIQQQIQETERLGVAVDEVGQQINQAFISDIQSGISGIFTGARKGFEGLRDAAISFGERLLDTLNDLAATSIVKQLEGLFKPDATNTQGTIGGFFSKLFGLGPTKQADAAAASATLQSGAVGAAAALNTGVTTASATFTTSVITSATSFASTIIAAGVAFAASVTASSAAQGISQGIGGLGSSLGAATGMFPAQPGGLVRIVEGGFPEAVLTTDPRHAVRQVAILRAFLKETRGLGGRIRGLAMGGFTDRIDISVPNVQLSNSGIGELAVAGTPSTMRLRQVLVDQRDWRNEINSPEGEQVLVDFLYKKQHVIRKLSGK